MSELLIQVSEMSTRTKEHAHVPLPPIAQNFRSVLFDFRTISLDADHNIQICHMVTLPSSNTFDLSLTINYNQHTHILAYTLDGSSDLFNQNTIQDLSDRFHLLCQQLFYSSSFDLKRQPICELSIILPIERDILQQLGNDMTTLDAPYCIHQAFAQQAIIHPNKLAITLDDQSLTYGQLLNRVQQLALLLINDKGVQPGDIICQCIDRSIEMIVCIMGIMMSGAVYAPLNPKDPFDRLGSLVRQVNAKLVLANQMTSLSHLHRLNVPIVDINEIVKSNNPVSDTQMEQLSQVPVTSEFISHLVFTSGSTGTPKAVQIRHRNFMSYMGTHFIQKNDVVLQLASCSFDVHLDEIDGALVRGAHLILLKVDGNLDFDYVTKVIQHNNITFVVPVPSWMDALGKFLSENHHAQDRVKQVQWWVLGGKI